jgi:hypothetical protein
MSDILLNIPNDEREGGRTQASIKYNKDCPDFECLEDGTIIGECKYCNLSTICRQVGFLLDGTEVPMESNYLPIVNSETGEVITHELFCTGMYDLRPLKERYEDDKVS